MIIPFFEGEVPAGFPSVADDYEQYPLDLHALLIEHPAATFFVKVSGDSMREAGIFSGDLLIVDRAIAPSHGRIVVALLNGEFTVKRLSVENEKITLLPANALYPSIPIPEGSDFQVWGVVTYVIHRAC